MAIKKVKIIANSAPSGKYIQYWENVVWAWLNYDFNDGDFRREIEKVFWNPKLKGKLRTNHIPGPYLGNPDNASVVILNYNPGGSDEWDSMKCHNCLRCDRNYYSIINYVDRHGYYNFAKDFPYLNVNVNDELKRSLDGGKQWWMKKIKWIDNLINAFSQEDESNIDESSNPEQKSNKNIKYPFAMEVCGWHSKKWSSNVLKKLYKNTDLGNHIYETVILPMLYVIQFNKTFGICIGKELGDMLIGFGFQDITNLLSCQLQQVNIPFVFLNGYINAQLNKNNKPNQPTVSSNNKKGRNYRLLKSEYKNNNIYIINTWVNGSNKHPSNAFFNLEKEIIKFIKKTP